LLMNVLFNTVVVAVIVQDIVILELYIPPIELHAITQCDIRSVEKSKFIAELVLTQILLAREINYIQIAAIHQTNHATIEFFN
ncbi:U32 family peptidase, partial [Salmonella enterica subsp. enterica serovar Infantis]